MELMLFAALVALATSLAVTPLVIRGALARGWVDHPDTQRRSHLRPVPRVGGIVVMASLTAGLLVAGAMLQRLPSLATDSQQATLTFVLIAGGTVFLIGLADDIWALAPRVKLFLTALVAVTLWITGFRIESIGFPYSRAMELGWLAFPITIMWVTGMTHALNLIDGLDGLASGIAVIGFVAAGVSAWILEQSGVVLVSCVMVAGMLGFLKFNRHPARVFLGDCGSLTLGAVLAVVTVRGSEQTEGAVFFLMPLLALAYPLLDTGLSMMRRWLRGVSFSVADRHHIHHRLLSVSRSYHWSVGTLYVCAAGLALLGLLVTFAPRSLVSMIALVGGSIALVMVVMAVRWLGYHEVLEAAASLLSALRNGRRVVQDKIYARDLSIMLDEARSLEEVEVLLVDGAREFGFLHMQLYRESEASVALEVPGLSAEARARAWRLEYPILLVDGDADHYVLRVWCDMRHGSRPYGAERAARLLSPALEAWVARHEIARNPMREESPRTHATTNAPKRASRRDHERALASNVD
jgi:UDP-GlcNAc:undecaprenyl-phosphate/decaprenyl-phosphate GlcNAc-1-phosphate transferase